MLIAVGMCTQGSGQPPSTEMPTGLANDITARHSLRQWPVRPYVTDGTGGTKPAEPRCEGRCNRRVVLVVATTICQLTASRDVRGVGVMTMMTIGECYDFWGEGWEGG